MTMNRLHIVASRSTISILHKAATRSCASFAQRCLATEPIAEGKASSTSHWLALAATAAFVTATTTTERSTDCQALPPNPLWPGGVSDTDIDHFVDNVLKDKSVNMSAIPDAIERIIYKSTCSITLNVIYQALSQMHGVELGYAHEFQLKRKSEAEKGEHFQWLVKEGYIGIDDKILEQVADRLLSNSAINVTLVPDFVERQLYVNCLKLIFGLLDALASSFCITLCGHDLRIHFEPSGILNRKRKIATSSITKVDMAELELFAREEMAAQGAGIYGEFMVQLNVIMYGLVLGVVDDLLANTEIELLSDKIAIDLVPTGRRAKIMQVSGTAMKRGSTRGAVKQSAPPSYVALATSFGAGMTLGVASVLFSNRKD